MFGYVAQISHSLEGKPEPAASALEAGKATEAEGEETAEDEATAEGRRKRAGRGPLAAVRSRSP